MEKEKKKKNRIYSTICKYNHNKCPINAKIYSFIYKCNHNKYLLIIQISYDQLVLYNLKYITHG